MIQLRPHAAEGGIEPAEQREPSWWHRDHPVFTPLTGFFTGLAFTLVVPGLYAALLESLFARHTVADLFPLGLIALVVPVVLLGRRSTRRFGVFFALGMVATAVVVIGVGGAVLWVMTRTA